MIQLIAVHMQGTVPCVLEFDPARLDPVQRRALACLPRSPAGVPELRGLTKQESPKLSFKLKVTPDQLVADRVPELLSLWEGKYTEARLKEIAKSSKLERDAAAAAGIWKADSDKVDLNALHDGATPEEIARLNETREGLASGKKRGAGKPGRIAKPKIVQSVLDATTTVNHETGERKELASASEKVVAADQAKDIVARMRQAGPSQESQLADPLELASAQTGVAPVAQHAAAGDVVGDVAPGGPAGAGEIAQMPADLEGQPLDAGKVEKTAIASGAGPASPRRPRAHQVRVAIEQHKAGTGKGPRLLELAPFDLFAMLKPEKPEKPEGDKVASAASAPAPRGSAPARAGIETVDGTAGEDSDNAASSAQASDTDAPALDWGGLGSVRLSDQVGQGSALMLPTSEVFEALGHLSLLEPLAVDIQWLRDAARDAAIELADPQRLDQATDWLQHQMVWRSEELRKWLGKGDLVSPDAEGGDPSAAVTGAPRASSRPPGWVSTAMKMAPLAQQIAVDIAMLELTCGEVEAALGGMPTWAVDAMQQMRGFEALQAENPITPESPRPGTAFRDCWRAELLRIDRWCAQFKQIKIARQVGLFGSAADQKLLVRLEALITRTKDWQATRSQPTRALAVWIAFALSLDHSAVAFSEQLASGTTAAHDAPARRGHGFTRSTHPSRKASIKESSHV
ncbi:hypothetical protein [Polaromonas sp. JS666]|uniref:hypothetical protein n=1 Tax=Polaromonas sp. (strain JS666 / ATCC BAA-500) TaxID=296591 RepID=UPI0000464658|nr:hypothetical protein [Polaromonas sp. JS666]ABE47285.1 hypothetical protein Bpro_5431 [Polaromonas sp. JS666]